MPKMRPQEDYDKVMAYPAGSSSTFIARETGIPRNTVDNWRSKPYRGNRVHGNAGLTGERARHWKGDEALPESIKVRGRVIARKLFVKPTHCEECGKPLGEGRGAWARHHKDGNTQNNDKTNVMIVCQSCHMKIDNPQKRMMTYS